MFSALRGNVLMTSFRFCPITGYEMNDLIAIQLAAEAADNGLLAPELAAGISRVKSAKPQGIRVGNWLSLRQAQALLSAPDITTIKGLRDRAIGDEVHRVFNLISGAPLNGVQTEFTGTAVEQRRFASSIRSQFCGVKPKSI